MGFFLSRAISLERKDQNMAALTSYSWIIYALVCLSLLITASGDAFNTADSNGDSSISRDEFAAYTSKLRGSMSAFLDTAPSENGQEVASTPVTGGDFMPATFNALVMILVTEIGTPPCLSAHPKHYQRPLTFILKRKAIKLSSLLQCWPCGMGGWLYTPGQ